MWPGWKWRWHGNKEAYKSGGLRKKTKVRDNGEVEILHEGENSPEGLLT